MERLITLSSVTAVTILSMGLALVIELALLKTIFHFMSHMKDEAVPEPASPPVQQRRLTRRSLANVRNAGL